MKLTANFSLAEMTKSETALPHDIGNAPDADQIENLTILCERVLQPVRERFGLPVRVNSGFRSVEVNIKAGGSETSDHCKGMAADIEIPGVANAELAQWIVDTLDFRQVILEFYTPGIPTSGWVHVSYNQAGNKKQVLTAAKKGLKTVYLLGLVA